jgi:hypothetical protein
MPSEDKERRCGIGSVSSPTSRGAQLGNNAHQTMREGNRAESRLIRKIILAPTAPARWDLATCGQYNGLRNGRRVKAWSMLSEEYRNFYAKMHSNLTASAPELKQSGLYTAFPTFHGERPSRLSILLAVGNMLELSSDFCA